MDSRIGLDYIVENKDYTTKLAAGVSTVSKAIIHYNQLRIQGKIVDIMTAVSVTLTYHSRNSQKRIRLNSIWRTKPVLEGDKWWQKWWTIYSSK